MKYLVIKFLFIMVDKILTSFPYENQTINAAILYIEKRGFRRIDFVIANSSLENTSSLILIEQLFRRINKRTEISSRLLLLEGNNASHETFEHFHQSNEKHVKAAYLTIIDSIESLERFKPILITHQIHRWIIYSYISLDEIGKMIYWTLNNRVTFIQPGQLVTFNEMYKASYNLPVHMVQVWAYNMTDPDNFLLETESPWGRRTNLTGFHLKCGIIYNSIVLEKRIDPITKKYIYFGPDMDMLFLFQRLFNFTYSLAEPSDGTFGALLPNGQWTGLLRQLEENEVDMVTTALSVTHERQNAFDFLLPYLEYSFMLILRTPHVKESSWSDFTREFTSSAWIAMGIAALVFVFAIRWITTTSELNVSLNHKESFFATITTILRQTSTIQPQSLSTRILYIFWIMMIFLFHSYYTSFLISTLTVIKLNLPFNNLKELYQKKEQYELSLLDKSAVDLYFMTTNETLKRLIYKDMVLPYPNSQRPSYAEIVDLMMKNKKIVSLFDELQLIRMESCDFTVLPSKIMSYKGAWSVQKASPLLEIFNFQLQRMIETGTLERMLNGALMEYKLDRCDPPSWQSIGIGELISIFVVLILTWLLSLVILTLEIRRVKIMFKRISIKSVN